MTQRDLVTQNDVGRLGPAQPASEDLVYTLVRQSGAAIAIPI